MTVSVLVDVTTGALCPDKSTCAEAIYINGVQQITVTPTEENQSPTLKSNALKIVKKRYNSMRYAANIVTSRDLLLLFILKNFLILFILSANYSSDSGFLFLVPNRTPVHITRIGQIASSGVTDFR